MKKKLLLMLVAALLLPSILSAYYNPGMPTGLLSDFAKMLTLEERAQLEAKLEDFEKKTGDEIAVVTISSLRGESIETFAEELFKQWGIGKKGKDNGVLLLIAKDNKKVRFEVGYGLEPYVTDLEAAQIIRSTLIPAFTEEKYFEGISQSIDELIASIQSDESSSTSESSQTSTTPDYASYVAFGIFGFLFLTRLFAQTRSWWLGGVIGAGAAATVTYFFGFVEAGLLAFLFLVPLGFLIDFIFSRIGPGGGSGGFPGLGGWGGSGSSSSGFGGFGGFGGGSSGGGGASGRW